MKNGKTYYVTKKVAIDDENLESVTLNGKAVEEGFALTGDTEATYIIRAVDKAGNVTEYTVYMKPISSITDAISGLTVDHVKSSDSRYDIRGGAADSWFDRCFRQQRVYQ